MITIKEQDILEDYEGCTYCCDPMPESGVCCQENHSTKVYLIERDGFKEAYTEDEIFIEREK